MKHCASLITQINIQLENTLDLGWSILPYPLYLPNQVTYYKKISQVTYSNQVTYSKKINQVTYSKKIRCKCLWKFSWARNQLNITWKETSFLINGKMWLKIMMNIQLIKINPLFMNELYFTKAEIIYDSTYTNKTNFVVCWNAVHNEVGWKKCVDRKGDYVKK